MNCKNCGQPVNGQFCSHCGQRTDVGRFSYRSFVKELSETVFQVDRGFFFTLRALFVRPGAALRDFLAGKRKDHFKPIAYVLTLSTLYFLVTQLTGQSTWMDDLITGWVNGVSGQSEERPAPAILSWFSKNYAYSTLLLLPVFSLASSWSFRRSEQNYLEHLVINSYVTGQQAIFYALIALARALLKIDWLDSVGVLMAVFYTFWVYGRFFSESKSWKTTLRTILTYFLYLLLSTVLLAAALVLQEL